MLTPVMKLITKIPSVAIIAAILFGFVPNASAATPSVLTKDATNVSSSSVTFNGQVDPNGLAADYWFEYGTADFNFSTGSVSAGSGDSLVSYSRTVSGLQAGTSYNFRIVAKNADGIRYGNTKAFTTSAAPSVPVPSVVTGSATNITSSSATINGQVDPNGSAARYWFEYALSTSSSFSSTSSASAGSGDSLVSYSRTLNSLSAGTSYKFRIVAQSESGSEIRYGNTVSFTTSSGSSDPVPAGIPSVLTTDATGISQTSATLNGQVDPNGTPSRYWFEFAPNSSDTFASTSSASAGSGDSLVSYSRTVSGLQPGTVYKFRIVAGPDSGTDYRYGNTKTFTTSSSSGPVDPSASAPSVLTGGVANVSSSSVTFNGQVDPNNASAEYWFEYGVSDFNLSTSRSSVGSGNGLTSVSLSASGLSANTTYNYRLVARNSVDIRYGSTKTFTTSSGGSYQTGGAPTVSLSSAYGVTKDSATFQGSVNPNGTWTEYWFEYGTTNGNLSQLTTKWSISGSVWSTSVTTSVYNLAGNTTYYYRLAAQNSYGVAYSPIWSFSTGNGGSYYGSPYVRTNTATNLYDTSAVLNGEVTPNNSESTVWFEYGYAGQGLNRSSSSLTFPASSSARAFAISVFGLSQGTRYDFRAVARNTYGTVYGEIVSFTATGTGSQTGSPVVSTGNYSGLTKNAAILWANVNPQNSSTSLWFEYGTSAFDLKLRSSGYTIPSYTGAKDYFNSISGLQADTLYFYRAVAQNAYGTNRGEVKFFRTSGGTVIVEPPIVKPPIVEPAEDLNVFLDPSVSNLEPKAGDTIDYVLTYRNASKGKLTASSLKVTLPFEAEYADASMAPTSRTGNNLVFYIGDIEKGNQGAIIIKVKVKDDAEAGSSLMFNSFLEYTDTAKEFQTVTSFIAVTVKAGENVGFLASLSAFARSISGSWLFLILLIIMLITIIYLIVSRRKDKKAAALAAAKAEQVQ